MKRLNIIFLTVLAITAICCNGGKGTGPGAPALSGEITISGLSEDKWTYFSFETGDIVGTSTFASEEEDAQWAGRADWDFAICGDYLKTNGGESGAGLGGLQRDTEHNFNTLTEAPENGYETDILQIIK